MIKVWPEVVGPQDSSQLFEMGEAGPRKLLSSLGGIGQSLNMATLAGSVDTPAAVRT